MPSLSDGSYLALGVQSVAGTAVIPDVFVPMVSESILLNPNLTADRRMKGLDWKSSDLLRGNRMVEGDLVVLADPDSLGHLLNMTYAKGSSSGDATNGYTHPFTPGDGKNYSIEIGYGAFARRIFGIRGDRLAFSFQDNKLQVTASIKALGQFYTASLGVALTGAGMTSATLSQDFTERPTDGLVVGDTIRIGVTDLEITALNANGRTLSFASTSVTASIGDPVFLLAQTPADVIDSQPLTMSNALVGVAATSSAADTAAAAKSTATPCYDLTFLLANNLLDAPATGSAGPSVLLNQTKEGQLTCKRLFENPTQYQKWIEVKKQAITAILTGRNINPDFSTYEKFTIKAHNTKLMDNPEPLEVGAYIFDTQNFEMLYDESDAKAVEIEIINRTDGADY